MNKLDIRELISSALRSCQAGDLPEAIIVLHKVLEKYPDNFPARNLLGVVFYKLRDYGSATENFRKALEVARDSADVHYNLGNVYRDIGRLDEAVSCYREALRLNPAFFEAYHNLGIVFQHMNRIEEAVMSYQKALQITPDLADAYYNLGTISQDRQELQEAIVYYRKALELDPHLVDAYYNLGIVYKANQQLDEAIACYRQALHLDPGLAEVYNNLGLALQEKVLIDEAIECFQKALHLNPGLADAYNNLGLSLREKGRELESIDWYRKALRVDPHFADAHFNLSLALLHEGRLKEGWAEYEWRWLTDEYVKQKRDLPLPTWDGSSLYDKTLFVSAEQGVGDELMFASCLPDIIAKAKQCVVEADRRLLPLFMRSFPGAKFLERSQTIAYRQEVASADFKIAAGSLPKFLRPDLMSFPQQKAYLVPEAQQIAIWRDRFHKLGVGLKVGISWRGGSTRYTQRTRSAILKLWTGMFSLPGVHFVNLQYGGCADELREVKQSTGVIIYDWEDADPLKDLDFFAAQIAALDLVISVDNATAHMAGAVGIPVWTLLPSVSDWRWMQEFYDTPWYPLMTLFRQETAGDWDKVLNRAYCALRETVERGSAVPECGFPGPKNSYTRLFNNELSTTERNQLLSEP
ncbi:MAG: tetratricopeptide repeat protein [Thermodesulfovibrionales bacterium]|nr:tetratricopeptide repeat protein [Thermodesulfovibrionales bacterium]